MRNRKYIAYSDIKDSIFAKNSFALAELNKPLVEALQAQQIHNKLHLFKEENDFVNGEYLVNNKYCVFYSKPPELQIPIFYDEWLNIKKPALLFGIGLGYGLKYLLNHSAIPKLYVYVRDKSLLKIALTLNDYASQILTERLVIVSQENLFTLADKVIEFILPEPLLFRENKVEYLTISRIIKTGKFSTKRAVILSGNLFVLDCATTLFDQGWDVFEIDRALSTPQEVYQSVENLQPDLVFQINLQDEMQKFNQKRVVVEWEIDPMASPIPPVESGGTGKLFIFTHNPDRLLNFQENNYAHCEYLPLCSNPHKFSPTKLDADSQKRFHCDLSFVGSLMFKTQQDLFAVLLDALDKQSREENEGWSKIGTWMQQLISNPPAGCKNSTLLTELKNLLQVSELPDSVRIHDSDLLITAPVEEFLSYLWRKQVISAIVPFGIHIWGKEEWKNDFAQNYRGRADHYLDLPKIYRASKINLDISRTNQPNIITMRVFDVLACGGFVLADRNEALLDLFREDRDIVCYDTPEEAVDKIRYYLNHENERQIIAKRGHETVINAHTFTHRMNHILQKTGLQ